VPGIRFVIVVVVPAPVIPPGLIVHVPVAGKPFNTTLPVGAPHEEGWVKLPTIGAVGAGGAAFITTSADGFDIHPAAAVTLKLYVPGIRFEMVVVVPVPDKAPGLIVQFPVAGKPFNTTLPVVAEHEEGCVIVPNTGAVGGTGAGLMTISADACDIHPGSL
jgi:FtsP/CotA-like multicopper oxidase with cupredoxin domain